MFRVEPRRPFPDGRLSDHLAVLELIPRQINLHAARKPVPHVRFHSLAVPEDVRRQDFPAKDVVQDERRYVALAARGVGGSPAIVLVRRIETPAGSDRVFDLGERVHWARLHRGQEVQVLRSASIGAVSTRPETARARSPSEVTRTSACRCVSATNSASNVVSQPS